MIAAPRALIIVWLCTVASCSLQAGAQATISRFNQFDPLYTDDASSDNSDAHTVSANHHPDSGQSSYSKFKQLLDRKDSGNGPSGLQRLPPTIDEENSVPQYASSQADGASSGPTKTTPSYNILTSTTIGSSIGNTVKRQVASSGPFDAEYLNSLAATPATLVTTSKQTEPPRHWSALDSYYQKLKQAALAKQLQDSPLSPEQYTVLGSLMRDSLNDQSLELKLYNQQRQGQPIYRGGLAPSKSSSSSIAPPPYSQSRPEFLSPSLTPIQSPLPPPFLAQIASALPNFNNQGQFSSNSWSSAAVRSNSTGGQQRKSTYESEQDLGQRPYIIQPSQQQGTIRDYSSLIQQFRQAQSAPEPAPIIQQEQVWPTGTGYDDAASRFDSQIDWRKLPDSLIFQQQQQARMKHQQETFGPWYDQQRTKEQLQEEAYCGPRNYVNYQRTSNLPQMSKEALMGLSVASLRELLQSQTSRPASPSAGEYPSHMGLYNGTTASDDNFICGATWINERFALTLASCIGNASLQYNEPLTVRAGEWNAGKQKANKMLDSDKLAASMVTRQVGRVHLFPRYQASSGEHNLALIEWAKPIDFLEVPYICPACQAQLRSSLQTSSCWAPVRSVSFSEYFDAEGDGETKLKRSVSMTEVPVKLIANHETECKNSTGLEYFNFQHPNYICSADIKRPQSQWRIKLNQTDHFGSGIYCNEGGTLNLVSILHPIGSNNSSAYGYLDLSYYKPWMRNVIAGKSY